MLQSCLDLKHMQIKTEYSNIDCTLNVREIYVCVYIYIYVYTSLSKCFRAQEEGYIDMGSSIGACPSQTCARRKTFLLTASLMSRARVQLTSIPKSSSVRGALIPGYMPSIMLPIATQNSHA